MNELMIKVPYVDFLQGVEANTDMESIRMLVKSGVGYCSDDIRAILGIPKKTETTNIDELKGDVDAGKKNAATK